MKKDLKSLLSEENIQVLVADDMAIVQGGTRRGGCRNSSRGRSGSKRHGGWGGCVPPRPKPCPPPRPRPCPPRPC
jgi:hypothetical protein